MIMLSSDQLPGDDVPEPSRVADFFGPESPLRQAPDHGGRPYEPRPQQLQMGLAIDEAFHNGEHLCVEAPTGVGKSFAYLIPAILHAKHTGQPVVISTHTIALQEQLLQKDIPLLRHLLDIPFSAALAKGRENYLCMHRLQNAIKHEQEYLPSDDLRPEIHRIAEWAAQSIDGTRQNLPFLPSHQTWATVCSEPGVCPLEQQGDDSCFLSKARKRLYKADIIVANHALLCVDLAMRRLNGQSLLPDYSGLVVDEAHTFEEVAAMHLGARVSTYGINLVMERLYRQRTERGLLARDDTAEARQALINAREVSDRFFARLHEWIEQQHENPLAYTSPGFIPNELEHSWAILIDQLEQVLKRDELKDDYRNELKNATRRLADFRDTIDSFLKMAMPDHVYWFELFGRTSRHLSMTAVPVEVNQILREELFNRDFTVVLTSATLAVRHDLTYFKQSLGVDEARTLILDSPFDFNAQVDLYLPYHSMPDPKEEGFLEAVCEQVKTFVAKTEGKAFVLFTSYSFMNDCAERLAEFFQLNRLTLLVQGRDLNRTQMLDLFRSDITSVIFGTDSFWMGVDVPGEALSNVIIVKLPFPVPTHPLVAARRRRIEAEGRSSFRDYFLPEAILKFRQGIGRLIRSRDDHGIIVVLDARIMKANYGKLFLDSIPDCHRHLF